MILTNDSQAFNFIQTNILSKDSKAKKALGSITTPAPSDVICGRGRLCAEHPGNREFRKIVDSHLDSYAKADSKLEKSLLVSAIVNMVRRNSPNGGFLKKNSKTGRFEVVSDRIAREKVGQMLRDALHTQYKSSTEAKRKRRLHEMDIQTRQMKSMIMRNKEISEVMTSLTSQIHEDMEDGTVERLFDKANLIILAELKRSQIPLTIATV